MPMLATFSYKNENRAGEDSDPMLCTSTLFFPDVTPDSMRKALSVVKGGGSNMSFAITTTRQ